MSDSGIRIATGSRLHFGLLDTSEPFGGLGVMIDAPVTDVQVSADHAFACSDSDRSRFEPIARRIADRVGLPELPRCRVEVNQRAPTHCGLGSGTQLSLAVTEAIVRWMGDDFEQESAHALAGRGRRSAVGTHGFFQGGLIFEDGGVSAGLNPLRQRIAMPSEWTAGIFRPSSIVAGVSGSDEQRQFARLPRASASQGRQLRAVIDQQLIPAVQQADFAAFADAVTRYNQQSGDLFRDVQGGAYNGPAVTGVVQWLINRNVRGVGQSSWGPGVFGWFESIEEAKQMAADVPPEIELLTIAAPRNTPRTVSVS